MPSHYETLRVVPTASLDEIKTAYRSLLLVTHPDKLSDHPLPGGDFQGDSKSRASDASMPTISQLQAAYAELKDSQRRERYDTALELDLTQSMVHPWESVTLHDMDWHDPESEYTFECRCGDRFRVPAAATSCKHSVSTRSHLLVHCSSCSNVLKIVV
jgi:diphthamide biosynthesis protein 4